MCSSNAFAYLASLLHESLTTLHGIHSGTGLYGDAMPVASRRTCISCCSWPVIIRRISWTSTLLLPDEMTSHHFIPERGRKGLVAAGHERVSFGDTGPRGGDGSSEGPRRIRCRNWLKSNLTSPCKPCSSVLGTHGRVSPTCNGDVWPRLGAGTPNGEGELIIEPRPNHPIRDSPADDAKVFRGVHGQSVDCPASC